MPQISLYIDKETLQKVEEAADAENISISKWVGNQLKKTLHTDYPSNFSQLFGSIDDKSFDVPERDHFSADVPREEL